MSEPSNKTDDLLEDLCSRWERGELLRVEGLLRHHPDVSLDDQDLLDLIYKEFMLREETGESPSLSEYEERFPHLSEEMRTQFAVHRMMEGGLAERRTTSGGPTPAASSVRVPALNPEAPPNIPGYEVLGVLAGGGMGVIYKARQLSLKRFVAIKVIRPERLSNEAAVRRFQREALASARLAHPNIVHVFDANQAGDLYYLVMEYVEGIDLAQLVRQRGPLPLPQACHYIRQAALGLQHAHERGLVHRDIKPSNLMLSNEGPVKLLDLGLARVHQLDPAEDSSVNHLTMAGSVLGTPDYMAPEQVEDPHSADIRSDLYSLGCTFFFLLTGKVLYPGGSMIQKLDRHRWQPPPPIHGFRSDLLPEVVAILAKLLAKKPSDRFQTAAELAAALQPFAPDRPSGLQRVNAALPRPDTPTQGRSEGPAGPPPGNGRQLAGHLDWVTAAAIAPDGRRFVSTSRDKTLRLWDVTAAREIGRWEVHADSVQCVAFTPDGSHVVTGSRDKTVRLWELATGRESACFVGHSGEVTSVAVAPDGRTILSGSADQTVRLWSRDTGRELRRIGGTVAERHWDAILCVAYTPDGRRALSGSRDKTLRLWDLSTGRELRCFRGPSLPVHCLAIAPDGKQALSGGGHTVRVWDLETGQMILRLKGHQKVVLSLAYAPDGGRAVSGGEDRTVRVWDLTAGREAQRFEGHVSWVTTVAVSSDGRTVISGSADRSLILWRLPRPTMTAIRTDGPSPTG